MTLSIMPLKTVMLSFIYGDFFCYAECRYAECRNTECCYPDFRYADCRILLLC
jgi:hypothetical protein